MSSPNEQLVIFKGNAPSFTVTISNENGPVDVSGATTIKALVRSADYAKTLIDAVTLTLPGDFVSDGTNGQVTIAFTAGNTDAARELVEDGRLLVNVDGLTYWGLRGSVAIRQDGF